MKIFTHVIGLLCSIALSIGLTFKILHWPGADELVVYGFVSFTLVYLPVQVFIKWSAHTVTLEKLISLIGLASGGIAGLSVLFKILHLQGADVLLLAGAMIFSFAFLPLLFYSMYSRSKA